MFRTGVQLMILSLLAGLALIRESSRQPLAELDEYFSDFLATHTRRVVHPPPITLVGIDEKSLHRATGLWTPVDYALFFSSANSFNPDLLATDEILTWDRQKLDPGVVEKIDQYQQMLREQVLRSPRVLLGAELGYPEDSDRLPPLDAIPGFRVVKGDLSGIPEYRVVESQAAEDIRRSTAAGFINLAGASDAYRSVPLLLRYCGQVIPSFVLQAAIMGEKVTYDDVEIEVGSHIRIGETLTVPIDHAGRMRVDFGSPIGRCSMEDLVFTAEQRETDSKAPIPTDLLAGRVLLLSRIDADAQNLKLAGGLPGSRGELLAKGIATIQSRTFIQRAPWWSDLIIVGLYALAALWVQQLPRGTVLVVGLLSLGVYVFIALAIFEKMFWISGVIPAGMVVIVSFLRLLAPDAPNKEPFTMAATADDPASAPEPTPAPVEATAISTIEPLGESDPVANEGAIVTPLRAEPEPEPLELKVTPVARLTGQPPVQPAELVESVEPKIVPITEPAQAELHLQPLPASQPKTPVPSPPRPTERIQPPASPTQSAE